MNSENGMSGNGLSGNGPNQKGLSENSWSEEQLKHLTDQTNNITEPNRASSLLVDAVISRPERRRREGRC